MEQIDNSLLFFVVAGVALLGTLASVVYYFARYFISTHENDRETIQSSVALGRSEKAGDSLSRQLANTRENIWGRIKRSLTSGDSFGSVDRELLEEILYTSDIGAPTVQVLMDEIGSEIPTLPNSAPLDSIKSLLRAKMLTILSPFAVDRSRIWPSSGVPQVWLIVGVNGAGKTTTIGKLARLAATEGKKVLIVPGDTFRAAAYEQLRAWADRANDSQPRGLAKVEFFDQAKTSDPSGVAFEGVTFGKANGFDFIIVDTAGRLHTQDHLMEELKKIKRVIGQACPGAPHESLIVLDANSGQNALAQAKEFHRHLGLSGVIMTKLDGSAKGGVVLGIVNEIQLPIVFGGVGEQVKDLKLFDHREFVDSIFQ